MKLEPGRETLSGLPFQPPPIAPPPVKVGPRTCSACGVADVTQRIEGYFDERGETRIEHLVTIELRYLKKPEELTAYLKSKGWRGKKHQGRDAMERFVCRPCLIAQREMSQEFSRKRSKELRSSSNTDSYYRTLCGD